jgi:hypothetical protein
LARGKIFLEQQDIVVNFCAQTTEGGHISRLEKGKVYKYLEKIRIGSKSLRSNLELLHKRHRSGVLGVGNVDEVEENLEEAYDICDDTIDSLIELHKALLDQGVTYDLHMTDEERKVFDGTGTKESIASIRLFLQNQKAVAAFYEIIIDEYNGISRGNKIKGQFYLNVVLLGTKKMEETLEDVIKTMNTESLSLMYTYHCGSIILSLKHFHIFLVGQGVPVDFKETDLGTRL